MKTFLVIASALLLLCFGVFAQPTISDPNAQVREATNFHGINVSSAFDVCT